MRSLPKFRQNFSNRYTTEVKWIEFDSLSKDISNEPKLTSLACLVQMLWQFPLYGGEGRKRIDVVRETLAKPNISIFPNLQFLLNAVTFKPDILPKSNSALCNHYDPRNQKTLI